VSLLGNSALALCALLFAGCSPALDRPNIVLIVIDTLRADRVSSYGYAKPTTPRIDAFASRGVRFENAFSTSSWTLPAHASMFTGLYPIEHGATQENTRLDDRARTLAEAFGDDGYTTLGVSGNGVINANSGLTRGFSRFVEAWREAGERPANGWFVPKDHPNVVAVREFLRDWDSVEPFFAFINFVEVHGPYTPPPMFRNRFLSPASPRRLVATAVKRGAAGYYLDKNSISAAEFRVLSDLYDGEVGYVDALVGALVDEFEAAGVLDDSLVVITSDHGENLGGHGHFRHVFSLYNDTVRVPLIALLPDGARAGEVRSEPVSLVDLYSTLLAAARIDSGASPQSRDILAPDLADEPVFAEYYFPLQALGLFNSDSERHRDALAPYMRRLRSVQSDGWRLLWSSDGKLELYNVERDPTESVDLAGSTDVETQTTRLGTSLADFVERGGGRRPLPDAAPSSTGAFRDLDPETEQQLRELGYLPAE
jgi:arylsulfatase A-like enzyme